MAYNHRQQQMPRIFDPAYRKPSSRGDQGKAPVRKIPVRDLLPGAPGDIRTEIRPLPAFAMRAVRRNGRVDWIDGSGLAMAA